MIPFEQLLLFAATALLMVLTPGPNMIYLISRSVSQGPRAGVVSLFGVVCAFLLHMSAAAAGLTALFMAVPLAYDVLKYAGAAYLLYLAWQASSRVHAHRWSPPCCRRIRRPSCSAWVF